MPKSSSILSNILAKTPVDDSASSTAIASTRTTPSARPAHGRSKSSGRKSQRPRPTATFTPKLRRRGLTVHDEKLTADNIELLDGITFAFLCLDAGRAKKAIVDWLLAHNVPFVDVGMGVVRAPTGLQGIVRVLTATPAKNDHLDARLSLGDEDEAENKYATNIQIAELNALNAALAVIRWKRLIGFYRDAGREHYASYQIATGEIAVEEVV